MLGMVCHTYSSREMKKAIEEFVKYGMTDAMTARHYHEGSSTKIRFNRFSIIRILLLLGFCFYY